MKSWCCMKNCGACCNLDLSERTELTNKLSSDDMNLIKSMAGSDGWCKYLDKRDKKCLIYENRPYFCRVDKFSIAFDEYLKNGDKFLIDCCKQHISSIYGNKSKQMKDFKISISKKWKVT